MIIALTGRADSFELVFQERDGVWVCPVPPPLDDGMYATELWATDSGGYDIYWTGMLYICDSRFVCLHVNMDDYAVRIYDRNGYVAHAMDDPYVVRAYEQRTARDMPDDIYIKTWVMEC